MQICIPRHKQSSKRSRAAAPETSATSGHSSLWNQHIRTLEKEDPKQHNAEGSLTSVLSLIRSKQLYQIRETHQRLAADLCELRSIFLPRLQRVERELMSAKLDRFFHQLHIAIQLTVQRGSD